MTLRNLSRVIDTYQEQLGVAPAAEVTAFEQLKGLPFYSDWFSSTSKIGNRNDYPEKLENRLSDFNTGEKPRDSFSVDFNHAIGLPQKNGIDYPLFDYEQLIFNELQNHKHLWILKATGLGITEFMLRYMAWLCLRSSDELRGSQMAIVTGPRIELAITLIQRMKGLFRNNKEFPYNFDTKETVIELNGCHIEAYPSHHLDAMRGLDNLKFIYLDEADFFPPGQQQDARDVSERYIAKSNPWIVMVSTPNAPDGLFERIEKEPQDLCLYHRIKMDYTYGLGKIYTEEEIAQARRSPSFEREYNLKYLGLIGNVFHTKDIDAAILKGRDFKLDSNTYTQKSVGLDPGFGSSAFGICITELVDNIVNVVYAEEFPRPDFNFMIDKTEQLIEEYRIKFDSGCRIFCDGANPSFIRALKEKLEEDPNYEKQIDYLKSQYPSVYDLKFLQQSMYVIPIPFAKYHKDMLAHCKEFLEYQQGLTAIHPRHEKLITALRTAVENGEGILDKEATSHDDLFDAFRMSMIFWH